MVLGVDKIHKRIDEDKLLENACERELTNPEGAGIDLRIGDIYFPKGEGFLGVEQRDMPDLECVARFSEGQVTQFVLKPGQYYVIRTVETINIAQDLVALFRPRTGLLRSGVTLFSGAGGPGYKGKLFFGMINLSSTPFTLELGARVAHVLFFKVDGKSTMYRGQWQGGRITTDGREVQV